MTLATLLALGVGVLAAAWDLRWRRIPRWLTVPALAWGLVLHAIGGGFLSALAAAALGLLLGAALVQLGAMGGGDAKLLGAMGALLGLHLWWWSVEFGVLAAAAVALVQVTWSGRLPFLAGDLGAILTGLRRRGLHPHPEHNLATPGALTAPFGVALALGVACAVWLR